MPANSEKPNTRPRSEAAAIVDVGQRVPEVSARAARIGGTSAPEKGPATQSREHEARGRVFGFSKLAGEEAWFVDQTRCPPIPKNRTPDPGLRHRRHQT